MYYKNCVRIVNNRFVFIPIGAPYLVDIREGAFLIAATVAWSDATPSHENTIPKNLILS